MNKLLIVNEVCELFKISPATLRRAFNEGRIPKPIRIGRRGIRWRASDLQSWLDEQPKISLEHEHENARGNAGRG